MSDIYLGLTAIIFKWIESNTSDIRIRQIFNDVDRLRINHVVIIIQGIGFN